MWIIIIILIVAMFVVIISVNAKPKEEDCISPVASLSTAKQSKPKKKMQSYKKWEKQAQKKKAKSAMERLPENKVSSKIPVILSSDTTEKVLLDELLEYSSFIDESTRWQLIDFQLQGAKYVDVPVGTFDELKRLHNNKQKESSMWATCASMNNLGMSYEKSGKIDDAIQVYEDNILSDCPAHLSYKRLMVLYHKAKDYENEERVIMRSIEVFGEYPEYIDRLSKLRDKRNS
jgi:hypothetical protein